MRGQGADLVGGRILPSENAYNARRGFRFGSIDANDACVGVRRQNGDAVTLTRQLQITDEFTGSSKETLVFDAPDRLTDTELGHAAASMRWTAAPPDADLHQLACAEKTRAIDPAAPARIGTSLFPRYGPALLTRKN